MTWVLRSWGIVQQVRSELPQGTISNRDRVEDGKIVHQRDFLDRATFLELSVTAVHRCPVCHTGPQTSDKPFLGAFGGRLPAGRRIAVDALSAFGVESQCSEAACLAFRLDQVEVALAGIR